MGSIPASPERQRWFKLSKRDEIAAPPLALCLVVLEYLRKAAG
jgi:hypothetical protein